MQNSKSEYMQLYDYINNNYNKIGKVKKVVDKKDSLKKIDVDSRLKAFFNIGHIQSDSSFRDYIRKTIYTEIIDESQYVKSFFMCSEIVKCHRRIYYDHLNYECDITDQYVSHHIQYLIKTNFRNILLELCNFENNQIIINYKDKIKDIIPAVNNNIMIDFNCDNIIIDDIFILKAIIYNQQKDFNRKIKFIKVISFGKSFDDISISELIVDENSFKLIEKLNVLRNHIQTKNLPKETENKEQCINCLYRKFCNVKKLETTIKQKIIVDENKSTEKQPIKLRNTFLF